MNRARSHIRVARPAAALAVQAAVHSYIVAFWIGAAIFAAAAAVVGPSARLYLKNMIRNRRYPSPQGIFLDRKLKRTERRYLQVRLDLARDADVLVVARDHPACAALVASRRFLNGAATPPHEEGTGLQI